MLLGNFYNITDSSQEGQTYRAKVEFNAAHEIFKGHFPDLPVVPGVCQTQMLVETLSKLMGKNLEMKLAHHIKFLALLNPTKVKELVCEIKIDKEEEEKLLVSASYFTPDEIFFRFKGEFVNG
jgi:3-hydroxyacyl-[acyl-carrier-protein] dehydratase